MHYIYKFTNIRNNMVYVGETSNIENRIRAHKFHIKQHSYSGQNSKFVVEEFSKFELDDFVFEVIHSFIKESDEHTLLVEAEFINSEKSFYPNGYNCKKYSKDGWLLSSEYCDKYWPDIRGSKNPNFGNTWDNELKEKMSDIKKKQHADGEIYNQEWRDKIGKSNSEKWASYSDEKVDEIMTKQSLSSSKYYYLQKTKDGKLVKRWETIREILKANPTYRRQGIYSNVNGYKGSHRGFVWEKVKR